MKNKEENKIVLVGESGVGKTCIVTQLIDRKCEENSMSTLSAQFCRKDFDLPGNKSITLDIWDTAGQELYRSLNKIYYNNAKAAILVYDITTKESFDEAKNYWFEQIKQYCKNDIIIAIAANKSDLYEERQVEDEEGKEYAKNIGAFFASTSAKDNSGIISLFEKIAMKILDPDFDFATYEQKIKEKFESKKNIKKGGKQNNKYNSNNVVKLENMKKKKKDSC